MKFIITKPEKDNIKEYYGIWEMEENFQEYAPLELFVRLDTAIAYIAINYPNAMVCIERG